MKPDHFNPSTYMLIDRVTGEEIDVAIFIEGHRKAGWEKVYAKTLSEYMSCGGAKSADILAWIITARDGKNLIHGTQKEIADKNKVCASVVKRVFKALYAKEYLKRVRSGCNMVSPKLIRNGDTMKGAMLLRLWDVTE